MFVMPYISQRGDSLNLSGYFLCPFDNIRFRTPVWSVNAPTARCECKATGKAEPFFYYNYRQFRTNTTSMPYAHSNICSRLKYSKPSTTSGARHALVQYFTENYPAVKRLKIKDHKNFFVARARYGQRVLYAKAYSLERLTEYFRQEFEVKVFGKEVCHA